MFSRKSLIKVGLLAIIASLSACSSPSTIKFNSSPIDAEVNIIDSQGISSFIGKTPLSVSENEVYKNSNRYAQVNIKKSGYVDHDMILMKSTFGSELIVNSQLKKDENMQNLGELTITQEKVANTIARANGLIQSKQYTEAESAMLNFIEQFPSVSVGYDYLGNIKYLQKDFPKALKYYNKALVLNPQNSERKVIVERLQNLIKSQAGEAL